MDSQTVTITITSLGILASTVGALIWLLKKLFNQNNTTIKDLSSILSKLNDTIDNNDSKNCEFQAKVVDALDRVLKLQNSIEERQKNLYDKVEKKIKH